MIIPKDGASTIIFQSGTLERATNITRQHIPYRGDGKISGP